MNNKLHYIGYQPFEYQEKAIQFGIDKEKAGLLLFLGSGKTFVSINVARYNLLYRNCERVLITCPTSILWKWKSEIEEQSEFKATVLHGTEAERKLLFKEKTEFFIINYEVLDKFLPLLDKKQFGMIISDESSRYIQTATSLRSKAMIHLGQHPKYKLLLTGTLISKRPLNLWPQFMFLDEGETFGDSYDWFTQVYFKPFEFKINKWKKVVKWTFKKQYTKHFNDLIYDRCIRITREDAKMEFPETRSEIIKIKFPKSSEEIYNEVLAKTVYEIETDLGKTTVNTQSIFQKLIRLQQITSGFIGSDSKYIELKETPKLDRLIEDTESIVDEDESIIIWCKYLFSIEMISNRLKDKKIKFITLTGKDSGKVKDKKWRDFQEDINTNVFVGQIKAGGIGLELFKKYNVKEQTQHSYIFEQDWEFDGKDQALGRSNRIGQIASCRFVDMIVEDSIDERIYEVQQNDRDLAEMLLRNGVENFLKRK